MIIVFRKIALIVLHKIFCLKINSAFEFRNGSSANNMPKAEDWTLDMVKKHMAKTLPQKSIPDPKLINPKFIQTPKKSLNEGITRRKSEMGMPPLNHSYILG